MAFVSSSGRVNALRIAGGKASADLAESITDLKVKLSATQISELSFSVLDTTSATLARQGWVRGATASYNGQRFVVTGVTQKPGPAGPMVDVTASSRYIASLKSQTGQKNWGNKVDRRAWAAARARSVGMTLAAPGSLGTGKMRRAKKEKGQAAESTWDLLVKVSKDQRAMIFEYGNRLVLGQPSWLVSSKYRGSDWSLWCNSSTSMHPALTAMPSVTWGKDVEGGFTLSAELLAPDAHLIRPGDTIVLTGKAPMRTGTWLVTDVDFSADSTTPVSVQAVRPYKLAREELKFEDPAKKTTATTTTTASSGKSTGGSIATSSGPNNSTRRAQLIAWGRQYVGRSIDFDGGYGAQCVDGFKMFSKHFVGIVISGNGKDNVRNAIRSGAYSAVSASNVQAGDIVSWGGSWGGGYGHIAAVIDPPRGGKIYVWHQFNGTIKMSRVSTSGVVGYARPKRWRA